MSTGHPIPMVREVMTERPVTATPGMSVLDLYRLFREHGLEACPVIGENDALLGIASRVDLLRMLRPNREFSALDVKAVSSQTVRDIMRYGVVTVEPEDPLVTALDLMVETKLHALPVVERQGGNRFVVGLITQEAVLRALLPTPIGSRP